MKNVMLAVTLVLCALVLGCKNSLTDSSTLQLKNAPSNSEEIIKDDNSVAHCPSGISESWCYNLWSSSFITPAGEPGVWHDASGYQACIRTCVRCGKCSADG